VLLALLDKLQAKGDVLAKFDLAKTFFGDKFETDLRNGVDVIDVIGKMRAALDGLQSAGGERIIPQSEIQNAQRMQAELNEINNKLSSGMAPILERIASFEQEGLQKLIEIKGAWADIVVVIGRAVTSIDFM
jgi:hypothetical protein